MSESTVNERVPIPFNIWLLRSGCVPGLVLGTGDGEMRNYILLAEFAPSLGTRLIWEASQVSPGLAPHLPRACPAFAQSSVAWDQAFTSLSCKEAHQDPGRVFLVTPSPHPTPRTSLYHLRLAPTHATKNRDHLMRGQSYSKSRGRHCGLLK